VKYPGEWEWCGYRELTGLRQRYRVIDQDRLLGKLDVSDIGQFRETYRGLIDKRVAAGELAREEQWTESLAVGSEDFVGEVAEKLNQRRNIELNPVPGSEESTWYAKEASPSYKLIPPGENRV